MGPVVKLLTFDSRFTGRVWGAWPVGKTKNFNSDISQVPLPCYLCSSKTGYFPDRVAKRRALLLFADDHQLLCDQCLQLNRFGAFNIKKIAVSMITITVGDESEVKRLSPRLFN